MHATNYSCMPCRLVILFKKGTDNMDNKTADRTTEKGGSDMNNIMEYKGYIGSVEFSESDGIFFGKVQGIRSLISYEGTNAKELVSDFHGAVDDYLSLCERENQKPEKAYKGSLNVRFKNADIHRQAAIYAITHGQSLNSFIEDAVKDKLARVQI